MAYTQGFKYDIFISYTHLDNHAPEGEQGWVEHFQKWLESWLARRFGLGNIEIWRDAALHGNTLFDERIPEVIQQSALFLALTSPHYFEIRLLPQRTPVVPSKGKIQQVWIERGW